MTFWEFRPIVETDSRIAWKLVQALAHKLREADARQSSQSADSARESPPELHEVVVRPSRVARERDDLDAR